MTSLTSRSGATISDRFGGKGIRTQLAYHGRLVLLLDGWNELRQRRGCARPMTWACSRCDYTQLGLVISTRRQTLSLAGPVVTVEALSEDQQLELARAARGEDGVELVDRAWRTPGVRELVVIPLYLNALLTLPAGAPFPETKEAVLRMFVQQNERAPARFNGWNGTRWASTGRCWWTSRRRRIGRGTRRCSRKREPLVTDTMRRLSEDGVIGVPPQPRTVIAGLVGEHPLVRGAGDEETIAFQHQVFQEWYASAEVEALMVQAAARRRRRAAGLREEILNWQSWEKLISVRVRATVAAGRGRRGRGGAPSSTPWALTRSSPQK